MNWKGFGRKLSWSNFKVYLGIRLEGLRKITKTSGKPVSGPRFEPGSFRIRSGSVSHSTTMFGVTLNLFWCNWTLLMMFYVMLCRVGWGGVETLSSIINRSRFGRRRPLFVLCDYPWNSPEKTDENYVKYLSGLPVEQSRFEPAISRIQV
jgi:hypothetical protein